MDSTVDFSFPIISDTYSYTIDSPPLWNPSSSTSSPNPHQLSRDGKGLENGSFEGQRNSFLCEKEDEKMDLLWEDFNEELSSTTASATSSSREQEVEVRCASVALAVAKTNGSLIAPKNCKPWTVMIVKVLKKLFPLSNSQDKPSRRGRSKVC